MNVSFLYNLLFYCIFECFLLTLIHNWWLCHMSLSQNIIFYVKLCINYILNIYVKNDVFIYVRIAYSK